MKTRVDRIIWKFFIPLLCFAFAITGRAQMPPPLTDYELTTWSFDDTNWLSDLGDAPISFTNLLNPADWDGNALWLDSTNPAWLNYAIVEEDGVTNLTFGSGAVIGGTVEFWFAPDWNSGTGPGESGRLIDVGEYGTNNPSSWWSLYLDAGGTNLYFSSETNGVFTNYLNAPISWTADTWHLIDLTYSRFESELYLDGQPVTNGSGVFYQPDPNALTNGFFLGSDDTGTQQARGRFDDLATYNYVLSAGAVGEDYTNGYDLMNGITPPSGDEDTNPPDDYTNPPVDYGSNLWLSVASVVGDTVPLVLSNTPPDVLLEIRGRTNLTSGDWFSLGFVNGSELSNWTAANVPVAKTGNLFLRIRSWQDSTGTGIPDWWWLTYAGQTTNVDAYALDPAGDNYTYLQKYQMGLDPTNYFSTNALANFAGCLDASGTNVFLEWNPGSGPVTYSIQRGIQDTNGNYTFTQIATLNSNADFFEDAGVTTNANWQNNIYNIEAAYPGTGVVATNTWTVAWYVTDGLYGLMPFGPPSSPTLVTNVYAYAQGTNVFLSWTPAAGGTATNYLIERGTNNPDTYAYDFYPLALAGADATNYEATGAFTNGDNWNDVYAVAAVYPGGGLSKPILSPVYGGGGSNSPAGPGGFYGYADGTGTNLDLTWQPVAGAVKYLVFGGDYNYDSGQNQFVFVPLGTVSAPATTFASAGGVVDSYGDTAYALYEVVAVLADGSLSQAAENGPTPAPTLLVANLDATGTNVLLGWNAVSGAAGYLLQKTDYYGDFYEIGAVGSNTLTFEDVGAIDIYGDGTNATYQVQAMFPNGGLSAAVTATISTNVPAPFNLAVTTDGTNAFLNWDLSPETASQYVILRGVYDPLTGTYAYAQIGTVGGGVTTYEDADAVTGPNAYNNVYQVEAKYAGGSYSPPDSGNLYAATPAPGNLDANLNVTAQLVRNEQGRWQLMFSSLPADVQAIALTWWQWDYFYDDGAYPTAPDGGYPYGSTTVIPANSLTNGIYVLPDSMTVPVVADGLVGVEDIDGFEVSPGGNAMVIQPVETNGVHGNPFLAGLLPYDEPALADGREELKQNLLFELRAATVSQPNLPFYAAGGTNYVESGFLHLAIMAKGYDAGYVGYVALDDLWPFNANYQLYANLFDPGYPTRPVNFTWAGNLMATPAPAVLGLGDPYWIAATGIAQGINLATGQPTGSFTSTEADLADLGASTDGDNLYLQSGVDNAFGLEFTTALVNPGGVADYIDPNTGLPTGQLVTNPVVTLAPGGSIALADASIFYSQTVDPQLQLTNYYFSPVNTPGTDDPNANPPLPPYPLPPWTGFSPTNQTGVLIASVGTPTVIGGWAKFGIQNGYAGKYAYLGQYFLTNAYAVSNGVVVTPTNQLGIVSPYGDFFPMQGGQAALITMPDPDAAYAQGTAVVDVVLLNVDANHDGTMDFSYTGPDFVSAGHPFRFWANDVDDEGDTGGDGIPGGNGSQPDGTIADTEGNYLIQGSRNLVNFFPVYLNIRSLFQSNALSAGISVTDTNYQFVLSQADGALRFAYTDLTPTNYMNFLQDTNEVFDYLHDAPLTTVSNLDSGGVPVAGYFLNTIAGNNGGIILVEAWTNTTQPLVLTIYHGTNQIAQTSLPLSITGVEQMFRSKTIMLHDENGMVPDRLTDADVPNEPDTSDMNFIFVHGYNVSPNQARGWDADFYKRLYWSGSHAKFYGVTWEAADSQKFGQVTINLQTNIVNAFNTAPLLNSFLNSLSGTNVVAAHSLGNMLVLSTLNDYGNQAINTYFMIDAAVAIEAVQGGATPDANMYYPDWIAYADKLNASHWWQLWPTNDARSTLTWNNRFANLQNADVYNFYSSGEEVLREYSNTNGVPPPQLLAAAGQVEYYLLTTMVNQGLPTGDYTWAWQEMLKGRATFEGLFSSTHGGWKFNTAYYSDNMPISDSQAILLPNSELQTNAFFDVTSSAFGNADLALYGTSGSTYAQAHRNRIISDAIPCLTLPVGANPVPILGATHNFNMSTNTFENNWPAVRIQNQTELDNWHHSDCRQVAYTFTHNLFDDMVTFGGLK